MRFRVLALTFARCTSSPRRSPPRCRRKEGSTGLVCFPQGRRPRDRCRSSRRDGRTPRPRCVPSATRKAATSSSKPDLRTRRSIGFRPSRLSWSGSGWISSSRVGRPPRVRPRRRPPRFPYSSAWRSDPVEKGLVASFARPGGNLTGFSTTDNLDLKRLEYLKRAVPGAVRIAVLKTSGGAPEYYGPCVMRPAGLASRLCGSKLEARATSPGPLRTLSAGAPRPSLWRTASGSGTSATSHRSRSSRPSTSSRPSPTTQPS